MSATATTTQLHLPDECWEFVFRFLNEYRYFESLSLVSKQCLSVTNHLRFSLKICDPTLPFLPRLFHRFPTLTSLDLTRFSGDLDALLRRISSSSLELKSLNISNHSKIPANGLRALSKKVKTLTSLTCSHMGSIKNSDMIIISHIFPFLEELDLSFPEDGTKFKNPNDVDGPISDLGVKLLSLSLPKLRKVNLSGNFFINDASLFSLCKNCEFLEEILIFCCQLITHNGIASAIRERPNLRSLYVDYLGNGTKRGDFGIANVTSQFIESLVSLKSLTCLDLSCSSISDELLFSIAEEGLPLRKLVLQDCCNYSHAGIFCLLSKCQFVQHLDLQSAWFLNDQHVAELSAFLGDLILINVRGCGKLTDSAFYTLLKNCPLLNEIKMRVTDIGEKGVEDSNSLIDFVVNPQVKSVHFANSCSRRGSIKTFVSMCPNLQLLDLSSCWGISECIVDVLRRCRNIRHLNIAHSSGVKLHGMNFEMPKLEVLKLSWSGIDDETLSVISKCCCRLLHLDLGSCFDITEKGVRQVVENCTQLREINLGSCQEVAANVVVWMVFSRPSLRKITAPPSFRSSESQRELFLRHGCLVCEHVTLRF